MQLLYRVVCAAQRRVAFHSDRARPRIGTGRRTERAAAHKAEPRTRAIPVMVLTSSRAKRDVVDRYRLGGKWLLTKPVDCKQCAEAVRTPGMHCVPLSEPPMLTG